MATHPAQPFLRALAVCLLAAFVPGLLGPLQPARAQQAQEARALALQDPAELEAFVDGVIEAGMRRDHIPGATVAVVKDGELFFAKGYGYADLFEQTPVDPARTLFRPGSVSKLFTWTAVMQVLERGLVELDVDVNTYLDFEIPATFPEPITMRHLLTHTPGFEDIGEDLFMLEGADIPSLESYLKKNLPQRVFAPGKIGAYSNYGTALAGYIVQRVAGLPFEEYVEQNIFAPLGMEHSTFLQPLPADLVADMAGGYNYMNGQYYQGGFEYVPASPAGGLSAPAADMARFMIAHLQNGEYQGQRILEESTAAQMHSQLFDYHPGRGGMAHGFFMSEMNGRKIISHGGDTILFHSGLFLIPDENVGLFVSTNGAAGSMMGTNLMRAFMDRYFPVEKTIPPAPGSEFAERIRPYLGEYSLARQNFSTFEKVLSLFSSANAALSPDGYLVLTIMGEINQFVEVEPGLLQDRYDPDNRLAYRMDEAGQAYLVPPIPFTFIKAPWYATTSFQGLLLGLGLVLFLSALVGWPAKALTRGREHNLQPRILREAQPTPAPRPQSRLARLARWTAALFGLLLLVFLIGFLSFLGNILPEYGVPAAYFGQAEGLDSLLLLPYPMAFLGLVMAIFAVTAWVRRWWTPRARLFYTLLALFALGILWQMAYWKLWL